MTTLSLFILNIHHEYESNFSVHIFTQLQTSKSALIFFQMSFGNAFNEKRSSDEYWLSVEWKYTAKPVYDEQVGAAKSVD